MLTDALNTLYLIESQNRITLVTDAIINWLTLVVVIDLVCLVLTYVDARSKSTARLPQTCSLQYRLAAKWVKIRFAETFLAVVNFGLDTYLLLRSI